MTNEQILKKAIEGVMKNGYKLVDENENWKIDVNQPDKENKDPIPWIVRSWKNEDEIIHPFDIIFSHDFAKAFWGEKEKEWNGERGYDLDTGETEKILETIRDG